MSISNQNTNSSRLREILTGQLGYSEERATELAEAPLLVILAETLRSIDNQVWFSLFEQRRSNLEREIAHFENEAKSASQTLQNRRAATEMEIKQLKNSTDPFKPLDQQLSNEDYARYLELVDIQESLEEGGQQFNQLKESFEQAQKSIPDLVRKYKDLESLFEGDFIENLGHFIDTLVKLGELLSTDYPVISNALVSIFGELTTQRSPGDFDLAAFLQLAIGRSHQLPEESVEHSLGSVQMTALNDVGDFVDEDDSEKEEEMDLVTDEVSPLATQEVGTWLDDDLQAIYDKVVDMHRTHQLTSFPTWIADIYETNHILHNFIQKTLLTREPRLNQVIQKIQRDLGFGHRQKFAGYLYLINALTPAQITDMTILRRKRNMMESRPLKFAFEVKLWFLFNKVDEDLASMISILIDKDPVNLPQLSFEEIISLAEANLAKITTKKVSANSEVATSKTKPQTAPLPTSKAKEIPQLDEYLVEEDTNIASTWQQLSQEDHTKLTLIGMNAETWEKLSGLEQSNKLVEAYSYQELAVEESDEEPAESTEYPATMDSDPKSIRKFVQVAHQICLDRVTSGYGELGIDFTAKYNPDQLDRITKGKGQWYQDKINQLNLGIIIGRARSVGYEAAILIEVYHEAVQKRKRWDGKPAFKNFMYAVLEDARTFVKELADGR